MRISIVVFPPTYDVFEVRQRDDAVLAQHHGPGGSGGGTGL